ncbi:MAG: hypothetical protein ACRYG7_32935 [Janthinobacterium lividum]
MKNIYHHLAALGMAAAALSSCSRAAYTVNSQTPAYLGTAQTMAAPHVPATTPVASSLPIAIPGAVVVTTAPHEASSPSRPVAAVVATTASHEVSSLSRPVQAAQATEAASPVVAIASLQAPKPTFGQRLALKKVMKQLTKAETRQQNTASVTKTAAKSSSLVIGIVGLAALIIGLIASSNFLIVVGAIVLVVGIVLLVLSRL